MKQRFGLDAISYLGDAIEERGDWLDRFGPKKAEEATSVTPALVKAIELRQKEMDALLEALRKQLEGR
jgi:hypothetical protein